MIVKIFIAFSQSRSSRQAVSLPDIPLNDTDFKPLFLPDEYKRLSIELLIFNVLLNKIIQGR
jgi:hypothetical protein